MRMKQNAMKKYIKIKKKNFGRAADKSYLNLLCVCF